MSSMQTKKLSLDEKMWSWLDARATEIGLRSRTALIRLLIAAEMEKYPVEEPDTDLDTTEPASQAA